MAQEDVFDSFESALASRPHSNPWRLRSDGSREYEPDFHLLSKSMVSSFRNNLPNRFEESYGDVKNLRGRHPLVSMGFLFVLRSTVLDEPGTYERAVDMLRKLKNDVDGYDATCVVVAEWEEADDAGVMIRTDVVPADLAAEHFLATLIETVLNRTPVEMHVEVRQRHEHRELPIPDDLSNG